MDIYYKINNEIINRYEKNRNYNLLININNINESIDNEINNIINRYNYGRNLNELIDIYMKMNMSDENNIKEIKYKPEEKNNEKEKIINRNNNNMKINEENKKKAIEYKPKENNNAKLTIFNIDINNNMKINKDEIEIKYKPKKNNNYKVRIFGEGFIENNRNKCKIIYKNGEYDLTDYLSNIDRYYNNQDEFTLKLNNIKNIKSAYSMFFNCASLFSLDISEWDTSNIEDMSYMFYGCESLFSLPDISKWNTWNVFTMDGMFENCESLTSLPDI